MRNLLNTAIITGALLATTGFAAAQPDAVDVDTMDIYSSNLRPGYAETIEMANVPALDETVEMYEEFEKPNLFMSDAGVYRYAYFEKTGVWLDRAEAKDMLNQMDM